MPKCTIRPSGDVVDIPEGVNLLKALRDQDIYVKSSCGGHASCTDCVIKIVAGEDCLTPPPFDELKLLGNVFHITKERLACQTCLTGDVTVDLSGHDKARDEQKLRQKTSKFSKKKAIRRTKDDVEKMSKEREEEYAASEEAGRKKSDEWKRHWENTEKDPLKPKRLGGNKRPKRR